MIKINLLPPYVFERQVIQRLMLIFVALLIVVVVGGVAWRAQKSAALANMQQELASAKLIADQVNANKTQATSELSKIGPITGKVKFIEQVLAHNLEVPALYEQLTRFTYEKVRYKQIVPSDTQLEIDAYAPSLSDAGRYLLNLYRATDLFSQVTMSSVPGYSPGEGGTAVADRSQVARGRGIVAVAPPKGFEFKVTCVLARPLSVPSYGGPVSGGSAAPGGAPSAPGMPPPSASPQAPGGPPPSGRGPSSAPNPSARPT
jgi:hypothetical protein